VVERVIGDHGYTERRACRLIGVDRTAFQYQPKRDADDAVRARLHELANERRRFGYRRLAIMLRRDGLKMNLKKVYRLYREERLFGVHRPGSGAAISRALQFQGASQAAWLHFWCPASIE
jgi:putative transposase